MRAANLSILALALLAAPDSLAAGPLPSAFTARCVDEATRSVFRVILEAGVFAYDFKGGGNFTAIRAPYWVTDPMGFLTGGVSVKQMRTQVADATFTLTYDGASLRFDLARLDSTKINFFDEIAKGSCSLVTHIPVPSNLDVGQEFKGPPEQSNAVDDTL